MRRAPDSFATAVRAFKELTTVTDDGAASRARVLAAADRASPGYGTRWRSGVPAAAALLVIGTASLAGAMAARRARRPAAIILAESAAVALRSNDERHATVVIPPEVPAPQADVPLVDPLEAEAAAYGRAHRAHFVGGGPARGLAAWDAYLRLYPQGTFAPEARFNRALCLVRLGRTADAARALRSFSAGRWGGYRRAEADRLLDWLGDPPPTP